MTSPFKVFYPIVTVFLWGAVFTNAATITTYHASQIYTCIGSFSACTLQVSSSGNLITNSGTVSTSGESVTYSASSVSLIGSLGGSVSFTSNTSNSSGPGIMVDALEQVLDAITVSYAPLNGQTGFMMLNYSLHGTNSATGVDAQATFGNHGVPYACVKLGINNPTFPFGCTGFDQANVQGTFSSGLFPIVYGQTVPLWFQLESIAGTGFGAGRATGNGSSTSDFLHTADIAGVTFFDQNMNAVNGNPTITSSLGISFNTPEPSTGTLILLGSAICIGTRRLRSHRS